MNKQELKDGIKATKDIVEQYRKILKGHEDNLADLQAELEQVGERWRAEKYGEYYAVGDCGHVEKYTERCCDFNDWYYNTGNYFATQAEAEQYKKALLMVRECECDGIGVAECFIDDGFCACVQYNFVTKQQSEEFAKALRLILNTKGV